jgi:hypothetical protein
MKRLILLALAIVLCPMCRVQAQPPTSGRQTSNTAAVRVPFELLKSQHIAVKVKINGKGPYRLIFDTGAPVTLLNNRLAKEADVIPKDFRPPLFAPFGSMGEFKIRELELGAVTAKDIPAVVMDHPTVELMSRVLGRVDGIVGMSFFGRYRFSIDYQARQLTLLPNGFQPPDVMKRMMANLLNPGEIERKKVVRPGGILGLEIRKEQGDEKPGVTISRVLSGSPAERAGLKAGDRLLVLDHGWTDTVIDCYTAATRLKPGSVTRATVSRQGKQQEVKIQVGAGL